MCVCNGLQLEYTSLHIVYVRTFWHVLLIMNATVMELKDWENRRQQQARKQVQSYTSVMIYHRGRA